MSADFGRLGGLRKNEEVKGSFEGLNQ